jgi:UDP-3-O-[3-hydroxymyristoyl] glucosamine N-acyltransferase
MKTSIVRASTIAEFLGARLKGADVELQGPRSLESIGTHSLVFLHRAVPEAVARINATPDVMTILTESVDARIEGTHIIVKNARLAFAKAVTHFFGHASKQKKIAGSAVIGENVRLGEGVSIGEYSVIEDNVRIGHRTRIGHHVVIAEGSVIGDDCLVMSHCVIGEQGFGFIHDEDNVPLRFPHVGRTEIGNRVEIGNFNAIPRAALDKTSIGDDTKTGDFVQIPHNARVGRYCLLAAYAKVGSGAVVEDHVFFGVRSSTRENVRVGKWAMIGQGAVVLQDVPERAVMAGVPAKYLRDRKNEGGF